MKRKDFFQGLKDVFEIEGDTINEESHLSKFSEYDSLATLALIAFIDEHFKKQFKATEIKKVTTVKSLMDLIGLEYFKE